MENKEPGKRNLAVIIIPWMISAVLATVVVFLLFFRNQGPSNADVDGSNSNGTSSATATNTNVLHVGDYVVLSGIMNGTRGGKPINFDVTFRLNVGRDNIVSGSYHDFEDDFSVTGYISRNYLELHGNQGSQHTPWTFRLTLNSNSHMWEGTAQIDGKSWTWPISLSQY